MLPSGRARAREVRARTGGCSPKCTMCAGPRYKRIAWVNPERVVLPAESVLDLGIQKPLPVQQARCCEAIIEWVDHLLSSGSPCGVPKILFAVCRGCALASPSAMDFVLSISRHVDRDWAFC